MIKKEKVGSNIFGHKQVTIDYNPEIEEIIGKHTISPYIVPKNRKNKTIRGVCAICRKPMEKNGHSSKGNQTWKCSYCKDKFKKENTIKAFKLENEIPQRIFNRLEPEDKSFIYNHSWDYFRDEHDKWRYNQEFIKYLKDKTEVIIVGPGSPFELANGFVNSLTLKIVTYCILSSIKPILIGLGKSNYNNEIDKAKDIKYRAWLDAKHKIDELYPNNKLTIQREWIDENTPNRIKIDDENNSLIICSVHGGQIDLNNLDKLHSKFPKSDIIYFLNQQKVNNSREQWVMNGVHITNIENYIKARKLSYPNVKKIITMTSLPIAGIFKGDAPMLIMLEESIKE